MSNRILIFDPVPFKGGSKRVMQTMLAELPDSTDVWVLSNDQVSWRNNNVNFIRLFSPRWLEMKSTGLLFFLKHFIYFIALFYTLCRCKPFNKILALSGPCVDFALYLVASIINIDIIQLIQGNISNSKVAGFGLHKAKQVYYLPSTHASILKALHVHSTNKSATEKKLRPFINGINSSLIKPKVKAKRIGFLWAASLVKWKHVEVFTAAITKLNQMVAQSEQRYQSHVANVCYIEPQPCANIDIKRFQQADNIHWHADPENLNDIRASSSVFISTAEQEPFGLSILEAMVAGLAIVIPADNAYWDQQLIDGYNCIKYQPHDVESLAQALHRLMDEPELLTKVAKQASYSAKSYSHLHCYDHILKSILN